MTLPPMTLARDKRLRKRRDYVRVQRFGVRAFGRFLVVVVQHHKEGDQGRVGFTVPKKVGAAHIRNKVKRRLRHIARVNQDLFSAKTLVIVARESAANASFADLHTDLVDACRKIKYHRSHNAARSRNTSRKIA